MYFEINVAKWNDAINRYEHLFATHKGSCVTKAAARKVWGELKAKFPEPEYNIIVICWEETGRGIEFHEEPTIQTGGIPFGFGG